MTDKEKIQKLHDASCSDGNCVFKITPEMRKGMRTNGGCCCLKDMSYGIGRLKTFGVMELSQIASAAAAALAAKDAEIARLRKALQDAKSYIRELQYDNDECGFCSEDAPCFTCGLLLSACDTITKALEGM